MSNTKQNIDKEEFIEVFNDLETYPTLRDVASYFSISTQKVSQTANRYRKAGEEIINRRTKEHNAAGAETTDEDHSQIIFTLDEDLNVSVKTKVNMDKMRQVLMDNGYINHEDTEDETIYHLAFILIVNETTTQLISEYT